MTPGVAKPLTPGQRRVVQAIAAFLMLCLLGGLAVAGWAGLRIHRAWASANWPTAPGDVIASSVERRVTTVPASGHSPAGRRSYRARVIYRYEVAGTEYTAEGVSPIAFATSRARTPEATVARYPIGRRVAVSYNPADPGDAVLEPGVTWSAAAPLLFGAGALCLVPAVLGVTVVRRLRPPRPRARREPVGVAPPGLPAASRIREVESAPGRVALLLPPGETSVNTTGWLGAIASSLAMFYVAFFLPDLLGPGARWTGTDVVLTVGFGGAGAGGLVLLVWWFLLRYESIVVRADDREMVIVRQIGFVRRKRSLPLGPGARAECTHHHDDNGEPVFAVTVAGADRAPALGVTLTHAEKVWLVERLNAVIVPADRGAV